MTPRAYHRSSNLLELWLFLMIGLGLLGQVILLIRRAPPSNLAAVLTPTIAFGAMIVARMRRLANRRLEEALDKLTQVRAETLQYIQPHHVSE